LQGKLSLFMNKTIGVDLGGTNIRAGIKIDGDIIQRQHTLLEKTASLDHTLGQLIDTIRPLVHSEVKGIGVAVPSVVDTKKGIVYNVVNIPSWKKVELKDILEKTFNLPVSIDNDANCFALGEYLFGGAKNFQNAVGLAIGTGLGTGIIIDGRIYTGNNSGAGEIGYLPYLDRDFEFYCSSTFFSSLHHTTAYDAYNLAEEGDIASLHLWSEFGKHLGNALKAIVYTYDPGAIVLGGSISKGFQFFEKVMFNTLHHNFHFPQSLEKLQIIPSVNENITLLGAGALVV
jgi:glucokinase